MEIRTLSVTKHRGMRIYIRNYGNVFEYIVPIRGEVYTAHVAIARTLWQRLMGKSYTEAQLKDIVKLLTNMAHTTIEFVLLPKDKKQEFHHGNQVGQEQA